MDFRKIGSGKGSALARPRIPNSLLQLTLDSIKEGQQRNPVFNIQRKLKIFEEEPSTAELILENELKKKENGGKDLLGDEITSKLLKVGKSEDDTRKLRREKLLEKIEAQEERNYNLLAERRLGFILIRDKLPVGAKSDEDSVFYKQAPPLDLSFYFISNFEDVLKEAERLGGLENTQNQPKLSSENRYKTSSLRLCYNLIGSISGLPNILYKVIEGGPFGLLWLDLSFNNISRLSPNAIEQIPNLKIFYLHGNWIADMTEVAKLQILKKLIALTLHGNPIEEEEGYRIAVFAYIPSLKHLDFFPITKTDKFNSEHFAHRYEEHWKTRHVELEDTAKESKAFEEMSETAKLMSDMEDEEKEKELRELEELEWNLTRAKREERCNKSSSVVSEYSQAKIKQSGSGDEEKWTRIVKMVRLSKSRRLEAD